MSDFRPFFRIPDGKIGLRSIPSEKRRENRYIKERNTIMENSYIANFINRLVEQYGTTLVIVIPIICWVVQAIGKFFVFKKAGKTPWHAFIPVLSDWDLLDLAWSRMVAWFWVVMIVISGLFLFGAVNAVFNIKPYIHDSLTIACAVSVAVILVINCYQLAKAFGKKFFFALGMFFLFPIFILILGLDSSHYLGPQE